MHARSGKERGALQYLLHVVGVAAAPDAASAHAAAPVLGL